MIGQSQIHGRRLRGLKSLSFALLTARPTSMRIVVRRDPSQDPNALLFAQTTNRNGTETKFVGSFELVDAGGAVTHNVEFEQGSAQSYSTTVPGDPNLPAVEEVVIITPKFTIHAAGKVAAFEARETTRHKVQ